MEGTKVCSRCGETKPLTAFHSRNRGRGPRDVQAWCKECMNSRPEQRGPGARKQTPTKINRNRARHRAVADLIAAHTDEFDALLEKRLAEAEQEAADLANAPEAKKHDHDDGPVRLRPGKRKAGEKAGDRIDVARCPHCVRHHDRGHVCTRCGTAPATDTRVPPRPAPQRVIRRPAAGPPPKGIDPSALADFNAGTKRAREAAR